MAIEYINESMSKEEFLNEVKRNNPNANISLVSRAYDFARNAHEGQKRLSGRDFFLHAREVSYMLARLGLDSSAICAGLLHDVLEDTKAKPEELEKLFGKEIFGLVEGVTKTSNIAFDPAQGKAENLRKIILATTKDVRVILIKLADRLHNMRTLKYQSRETQLKIAKETMDVYVPIAYKLGMYKLKSELEDLSFKFLEPRIYQDLKTKIAKKKHERDKEVRAIVHDIMENLAGRGVNAKVYGRAKHFYSIYKKMLGKNLTFGDIHDLYAVRILTDTPDNCYRILGLIHSLWHPIPGSFNDYIAAPKPNMYQSLHTEIMVNNEQVEAQIRTYGMHHVAEEGIAAHWRYKGTERDKRFDRMITWLKQILDWVRAGEAKENIETFKINLFKDEIFVFTPKGDPILLPEKSSPVDFAYAVHTDIGNHCDRAKVNGSIVPLNYELNPGDIVEIITSKRASPSRNWLNFVKTTLAKGHIRQSLNIILDRRRKTSGTETEEEIAERIEGNFKKGILKISGCCNPQYNSDVIGYRMKDGKTAVHLAGCINVKPLPKDRILHLKWKTEKPLSDKIIIEIVDRLGIFSDILNVLSKSEMKVIGINTKTIKEKLFLIVELETSEFHHSVNGGQGGILSALRNSKGISGVPEMQSISKHDQNHRDQRGDDKIMPPVYSPVVFDKTNKLEETINSLKQVRNVIGARRLAE